MAAEPAKESQEANPAGQEGGGDHLTLQIVIAIVAAILFSVLLPRFVGIGSEAAAEAYAAIDTDADGNITLEEFTASEIPEGADEAAVKKAVEAAERKFGEIDEDADAAVSPQELRVATNVARAAPVVGPLELGGEIFLNLLKMMVVPLVLLSVMSGILGMGDVRKLGRPGLLTITFYVSTTILAVVVGLCVVNVIRPGKIDNVADVQKVADERGEAVEEKGEGKTIGMIVRNLALMLFTDNLVKSAAETELLPLIVFAIVFAAMLTTLGERVDSLLRLIEQGNHAILHFVLLLMRVAPLGIFCLVAGRFASEMVKERFVETMQLVGWYSVTVLIGLAVHALITLPALLWFFTKRNPYVFMYQMSQALLTAFSTASSSATLPVTMECATTKANVKEKAVEFVTPLGATINMDGTALYEAVAAIFIAQLWVASGEAPPDFQTGLLTQLTVALTATLAAIGAAGIPEAGLVTMLIVLNAVGLPLKYQAVIIPVDWLLDRFRTAINVLGDATGAAVIENTLPDDAPPPGAATAPATT